MARAKAEAPEEKPGAGLEGRGLKSREHDNGASGVTATRETYWAEAETRLMEEIISRANMQKAYNRVISNKGAAGVDNMSTGQLKGYLQTDWPRIKEEMLNGTYNPQPVRKVEIPKPGGGTRMLGIPTVLDRLIQQAVHQELGPLFESGFSVSSYGFRPGKSAHQAVQAARKAVSGGLRWVVDIDLAKFLDTASYCTPCHERSLNKPCWTSNTLIYKPVLLPERTWTAEISPRFTRCNTVWRDTPRSLVASNIGTSPSGACSTKRLRTSSLRRMHHGAPGVICSPAMKPSETHRCTVEGAIWRISAAFAIVTNSPSVGAVPGSNRGIFQ